MSRKRPSLSYSSATPGEHALSIRVGDLTRDFLLHVPESYDVRTPRPLVLIFHGGGGSARVSVMATGWSQKAEEAGFVVVYPEGVREDTSRSATFLRNPRFWNVGAGIGRAEADDIDDVGFVRTLLDELPQHLAVDQARVYAGGFSNGASMAFESAMHLSDRFAAIGAVSGHLWRTQPPPTRPVSLIYITGSDDPMNPLHGGVIESPWDYVQHRPPIADSIRQWGAWIGCEHEPTAVVELDGVRRATYGPGKHGAEIEFYTIAGAGHVWPGGPPMLAERISGPATDKLDATEVIWDFFKRHLVE